MSFVIVNRVSEQTRGVQGVIDHYAGIVPMRPYIWCIQHAECVCQTIFGDDAELVDDLATG